MRQPYLPFVEMDRKFSRLVGSFFGIPRWCQVEELASKTVVIYFVLVQRFGGGV